jgi:lipid-A-disaccharide synthase
VVMYRLSWVSYWITRWFILKKLASNTHGFIALPNILAKKAICPEFLQGAATLDAIESAMISLMGNNSKKYNQMVSDFSQIKTTLITDDSTYSMVVGLL